MPKLDAGEVKQTVEFFENDQDQKTMRETMVSRWAYYSLLDAPDLPDHMTRGESVEANTPFIGWITDAIIADVTGYPTFATVIPVPASGSKPTPEEQRKADQLEKWCNLLLAVLNEGKTNERDWRWHQLNSPYCCPLLKCERDDDGRLRFVLETPAPETCFFPVGKAPGRPSVLARRYKVLVKDVERTYSDRRGSKPGHKPVYTSNRSWQWEEISDDKDVDESMRVTGSAHQFEEVELLYLDDGENVYHMALNGGKDKGELMWSDKNRTGGVGAVILPGRVTPLRGPDRYWPGLYPIYQMVKLLNRLRAKRETRSDQARADIIVAQGPDEIKADAAAREAAEASGQDAAELEMAAGQNIIKVPGQRALLATLADDPDLAAQEQAYWQELTMYAESVRETTSAEEMAKATANSYLAWSDSKKKQQAPMLDHAAYCWAEILRMCIHAVQEFDEDYELMAETDLEYGAGKKIATGDQVALKASELEGFKYVLKVETKSMTEQEIRFRVQDWAERHQLGIATLREGVVAGGYSDEQGQLQALFEERGFELAQPFLEQQVQTVVAERVRLSSRILISPGAPPPQPVPTGPVNPAQSFSPMQAPMVPGPTGDSGAGVPV